MIRGSRSRSRAKSPNAEQLPFLTKRKWTLGPTREEDILNFLEKADELVVLITQWALNRLYVCAELGAAWGRRIPIVGLLHGLTASNLQSMPGIPILLKKRDLLSLNEIDIYLRQLRARVRGSQGDSQETTE